MADNIQNRLVVSPRMSRKRQVMSIPKSVAVVTLRPPASPNPVQQARAIVERHAAAAAAVAPAHKSVNVVTNRQRVPPRAQPKPRKQVTYLTSNNTELDVEKLRNIRGLGMGRILIIIGNGPSILEIPLELLKDQPLIDLMTINHPDSRIWPTKYWSFFDSSQATRHQATINTYDGVIFNSTSIKQRRPNSIQIKNLGASGFSRDLTHGFNIGQSSVYVAMQISMWLNYEHTYILGCDMSEINGRLHFYGVNHDVDSTERKRRFVREAEYYSEAARLLSEAERKKYTFCSSYNKYPFVSEFNQMDHSICIHEILGHETELLLKSRSK